MSEQPPFYPSAPPPPPPGYGPQNYGRPAGVPSQVTTSAVLLFVAGGFSILGGLLLAVLGTVSAIFVVVGLVLLVIGGVEIWVGVALRQLKSWARTTAMVLAGIGIVFGIISIARGGFTSIVGLVLDAVIIYLLTRPEAVNAFRQSGL